jgi:hypothetical protein
MGELKRLFWEDTLPLNGADLESFFHQEHAFDANLIPCPCN